MKFYFVNFVFKIHFLKKDLNIFFEIDCYIPELRSKGLINCYIGESWEIWVNHYGYREIQKK